MPHPDEAAGLSLAAAQMAQQDAQAAEQRTPTPHLTRGAWVPVDASGAGLALTTSGADWIKHENLVIARFSMAYPVTASALPTLIGGLPFPVENIEAARQGFMTVSTLGTAAAPVPEKNTTTFALRDLTAAILTNVAVSGKTFYGVLIYTTPN